MHIKTIRSVILFVAVIVGILSLSKKTNAQEIEEVKIKFTAQVGNKPFNCGSSYSGLGKSANTIIVGDFRFYISEVALINKQGKAIPIYLSQDGKWQYQNVALLDFENKSGDCVNGTKETRNFIVGKIPKGDYQGLQFTLGVPFNLNHEDSTLAPSPLNLTSLWWNWRAGYKFLRLDLNQLDKKQDQKQDHTHGKNSFLKGEGHHSEKGFPIHLGSTGCQVEGNSQKPISCSNPNTAKVIFTKFDYKKNTVVTDIKALLANTDLTVNEINTPVGCMSAPNDDDCMGIMNSLGIPFNNSRPTKQTFFNFK